MNAPHTAPLIVPELHGPVLRLTLNRPEARNALSVALMGALQEALDGAAKDKAVRTIVIAAEGKAFCAGHDLKEMTASRTADDKGKAAYGALFTQCSKLMQAMVRHPKPVIAEVQGIATAAGCQLVASCDLAVASSSARFATPGVNIGLFCSTPMVALSRNLSRKHAMEMLLTGDHGVWPRTPRPWGSSTAWWRPNALEAETMELAAADRIQAGRHGQDRQGSLLPPARTGPDARPIDYASQVMTENMLAAEAEEGICAFLEKRTPEWPK